MFYADNWQEIQKQGHLIEKKLLKSKFVSPKCSNCPLIFEFPAKYEQKVKKFIGNSEKKTSQRFGKPQVQPPQSMVMT